MKKGHDNSQKFKKITCLKRKKSRLGCIIKNFIIHLRVVSCLGITHFREKCVQPMTGP